MIILDERDQREIDKQAEDGLEEVTTEVKRVSVGRQVSDCAFTGILLNVDLASNSRQLPG